ncbi:MAG: SRPBCC domain-containing protein [Anaerolineae bacterium]
MANTHQIKFKQAIQVPPAEVYRAFTHPLALRDWLSDQAQSDPRVGGRLYLYWSNGYIVTGEFVALTPGSKVVWTWQGSGEPEPTRVQMTFAEKSGGTVLTLVHSGLGSGKKWAEARERITRGWEVGLENLQSVLETGVDLRAARRPRLGIFLDQLTAENAAQLGVPVQQGVLIHGTMEGSGARAAGLQENDVLVKMGSKRLTGPADISAAVQGKHAGDRVPVVLYRGAKRVRTGIELSAWPIPHVPATAAELAAALHKNYAQMNADLAQLLEGVTEAEADYHPAPDAWSIKELVAHFIACERDYQSWMADMANDNSVNEYLEERPNVTPRLQAIVKRFPTLPQLVHELESAETESLDFVAALPSALVSHRHVYRRAANWATEIIPMHLREEHGAQFRATVAAARASAAPGAG